MAMFSPSRYFTALLLLNLCFKFTSADSFGFKNFGKDSNFESQIGLYGDAKVAGDNVSVQVSGSQAYSAGRMVYKKPVKLVVDGNPTKMLSSFSMYFAFSLSGDGLAAVMVPNGYPLNEFDGGSMGLLGESKTRFLAVEFDSFKDEKNSDVNDNHVGLDVDSLVSVKISNVSSTNLVLGSGEKLQAWIDYEASSKRFEVRLSKLGHIRPESPLLSYPIDLSKMWNEEEIFVGLSSSSGNSSGTCYVYSWSFRSRTMPHWMHSQPLDPETFVKRGEEMNVEKRSDCALRILTALVLGTGCGALGAIIVLFLWTILGNKRPVVPEEFVVQPTEESNYKKFNVAVDKNIEDGKK